MSDVVEQIMRLKAALARTPDASDSEEEQEITAHTNRGHKLEHGARYVSSRTLNVPLPPSPKSETDFKTEDADLQIDVEQLLQPISDPAEVPNNAVIARTFRSPFIEQLSEDLLNRLVEERATLAKVSKLLETMLGDDDAQAMPQIMARVEPINPPTSHVANGYVEPPNGAASGVSLKNDGPRSFFAVPELTIDRDLGLPAEEAHVLRERLQVVQQRMDEYVRCIAQIRSGFTTAMRLRRNVMNWCREINGDDYVKLDLDEQNGNDNAGLGEKPAKDYNQPQSPSDNMQTGAEYEQ